MDTFAWFRSRISRPTHKRPKARKARSYPKRRFNAVLAFERLQDRAMLSINAVMNGLALTVTADNSGNNIVITSAQSGGVSYLKVNGNDVGTGVLASLVTFITVNGGSGNDT